MDETKDLKTLIDYLIKGAEGKVANLSEEKAKKFEDEALKVINESSNDLAITEFTPIMEMNILKMNIHFFDNLPRIFNCIQNAAEISVREAEV